MTQIKPPPTNSGRFIIDHWANSDVAPGGSHVHRRLAKFVAERYRNTVIGPLTLHAGNFECNDLLISCMTSAASGIYLICACDHDAVERLSSVAGKVYDRLRQGASISFRLADGRLLMLSNVGGGAPRADDIRIVLVVTQGATALNSVMVPDKPVRLFPLADFITIFDSLTDLEELERYWEFVDAQHGALSFFSSGPADLYASFVDTHGVLVEGAISPTMVMLASDWGTSRRFEMLAEFWSQAPSVFPDHSTGWRILPHTNGVVGLQSRHHIALAYSTVVGGSTIQTLVEVHDGLDIEDGRMLDLFAQLLADRIHRCGSFILDAPLFQQLHILFVCEPAPSSSVAGDELPPSLEEFPAVVTSVTADVKRLGTFRLKIDTRAVLAGLHAAKDASFEVRCSLETLTQCHAACALELPVGFTERFQPQASELPRYHLHVAVRHVDVPDYVEPVVPSSTDYKRARKQLATEIMAFGLLPGKYELADAKARIDLASARLRAYIERRLESFDRSQLLQGFIEQHDALILCERLRIQQARQSLVHDVDYDRLEAIEQARNEFGLPALRYRYLLEKTVSAPTSGAEEVNKDILRELVGLVDWHMVLTGASDVLHNAVDVGGVVIDDSYIPEVFYSEDSAGRDAEFAHEYAKSRLGLGFNEDDVVEGAPKELLSSEKLKNAFITDVGFDLQSLLAALGVLAQAQRYGLGETLSLSYTAEPNHIAQTLADNLEGIELEVAHRIVSFLTLSETGLRRLAGRDVDEVDVPYWEHSKRIHRYAIRPLVVDGANLRWGAEMASRAMNNWMSAVRDGFLPADFEWPHINPVIRDVKKSIETRLELRTEEIFRRHTQFVIRGIDFRKKFRDQGFADVGDYDVLAYWPGENLVVTVECKYNQPYYTIKDGRRLRDKIFGKSEDDRSGQFSRILRRRQFLEENRARLLALLDWPGPETEAVSNTELYVSRDIYFWMIHPPYNVPTQFVRIDALDSFIKEALINQTEQQTENN